MYRFANLPGSRCVVALALLILTASCVRSASISLVTIEGDATYPSEQHEFQMPVPRSAIDRAGQLTRVIFESNRDLQDLSERDHIPAISYELTDCALSGFRQTGDLFPLGLRDGRWLYAAYIWGDRREGLCFALTGGAMFSRVQSNRIALPKIGHP